MLGQRHIPIRFYEARAPSLNGPAGLLKVSGNAFCGTHSHVYRDVMLMRGGGLLASWAVLCFVLSELAMLYTAGRVSPGLSEGGTAQ